jgi:hypothetical protein
MNLGLAEGENAVRRHRRLVICTLVRAFQLAALGLIPDAGDAQTKPISKAAPNDPIRGGPSPSDGPLDCTGSDPVKYPTPKTIGRWNYIIYNKCNAIRNLHLRFEVTKELTAEHNDKVNHCSASQVVTKLTTTQGIFIQFNAFSRDAPRSLIQYIFGIQGKKITPHIQYAGHRTPDNIDHDWQQNFGETTYHDITLEKDNTIPKNFAFDVDLSTNENGFVTAATFTVEDAQGVKHPRKVPPENLYPLRISEFQTDISTTNFQYIDFGKGGAGTLSYSSTGNLLVEGGSYEHCAKSWGAYSGGTCETSNASYGEVHGCGPLTQSVTVK